MKNLFVEYTKAEIKANNGNIENITFELMSRCISEGVRIIIEQEEKKGQRYLMVDFSPTDKSNTNFIMDDYVCAVTSVDGEDEGDISEDFTNYLDACRWLASFLSFDDYTTVYIETY
jgi:hypothetical protein